MSSIRFAVEEKGYKGGPGRTFLTRDRPDPRKHRGENETENKAPPPKVEEK